MRKPNLVSISLLILGIAFEPNVACAEQDKPQATQCQSEAILDPLTIAPKVIGGNSETH